VLGALRLRVEANGFGMDAAGFGVGAVGYDMDAVEVGFDMDAAVFGVASSVGLLDGGSLGGESAASLAADERVTLCDIGK
jgi:hypothetical protein